MIIVNYPQETTNKSWLLSVGGRVELENLISSVGSKLADGKQTKKKLSNLLPEIVK